jgi:hypothetical protein
VNYPTKPGSSVILDLPDEAYHRLPELSSSQAKTLLESPKKFDYWRGKVRPPKAAFDVGHAVHAKVLGTGADIVEIPSTLLSPDGGIRSNDAKAWVEDARAAGQVPMKAADLRPINEAAESVLRHERASVLFSQPGNPEVSVLTTDPVTQVPIRARFDYLPYPRRPRAIAVDLKTTDKEDGASPRAFNRQVEDYRYYLQQEWYRHVYRIATGEEIEFAFVVVEMKAPYLVGYYDLSERYVDMGRAKGDQARAVFAECTRTGIWPGYSMDLVTLEPRFWAALEIEEEAA